MGMASKATGLHICFAPGFPAPRPTKERRGRDPVVPPGGVPVLQRTCTANMPGGTRVPGDPQHEDRPSAPRVWLNPAAVWELLDRLDISQNQLARLAGISPGHLSLLMNGKRSPAPPSGGG